MAGAIEVQGLAELQRGFRQLGKDVDAALRVELRAVAEPVRSLAERKAGTEIRNMLSPTAVVEWQRMRVGFTRGVVYVAPQQRGLKYGARKRPNLAGLLLDRAMQPALEEKTPEIVVGLESAVGRLVEKVGF